jgi:hypothetical protein
MFADPEYMTFIVYCFLFAIMLCFPFRVEKWKLFVSVTSICRCRGGGQRGRRSGGGVQYRERGGKRGKGKREGRGKRYRGVGRAI